MNYNKIWNIGLNTLSGAAIMFVLLLIPPYLTAFTNESNDVLPELKAQEYNYFLNQPIEELNNLTLKEVFEDGNNVLNPDFNDGLNGWYSPTYTLTVSDNILIASLGTSQFSSVRQNNVYDINNQFYVSIRLRDTSGNSTRLVISELGTSNAIETFNPIINQWYTLSGIFNTIKDNGDLYIGNFGSSTTLEIDGNASVYAINMTNLGLDNLTQEQMDYYYDRYLRYKDSTINDYTTVFNNYLSLAPDSNPFEIVKPIEYYMNIILETYDTISNFWSNVSNLFVTDIIQDNAFEIYDKWWFKPFLWLIGD